MISVALQENDVKSFEQAMHREMEKPIKHFEGELIKIRTGRAHTSLVEDLPVTTPYSDTPMSLKSLAAISAPDARLITIQPWDTSIIGNIEKAIIASDLGLTPNNDGRIIRLTLPQMTQERRGELIKILHKKAEESRVAVRNVRKEFHNIVRDGKKNTVISEDFHNRLMGVLQRITDTYIEKIDTMAKKKEQDLTTT